MGLDAATAVEVEEEPTPRRKKKMKPAPHFERGMQVRVDGKWNGVAKTLKPSSESGWWYEVENERTGMTWVCHESHVKPLKKGAKSRAENTVPLRRRRQGRARTRVATALG